jgi:hypothetical protein
MQTSENNWKQTESRWNLINVQSEAVYVMLTKPAESFIPGHFQVKIC